MLRRQKVQALVERAATPGEREAAEAALTRISALATRTTRLTDAAIKALPLPASGYVVIWDDGVAGFGARITSRGARSYVFNYRVRGSGQQRRITIGQVGNWSTGAARTEAKRLRRLVDAGDDPRGELEDQREAPTMADLIDRFEREHLPRKRASTIKLYKGVIRKHIRPFFGKYTKAADVGFADIDRLHQKVTATAPYSANRVVAVLSKMFALAIRWEMRADNPCKGIERNPESKRRRYLTDDELKRLTKALADTPDKQFVNSILLLVLTGARKSEVLSMRWDALTLTKDRGVWTKLGSTTKQKTDHVIPISAAVRQVLAKIDRRSEWVFPSSDNKTGHLIEIKNGWAGLCKRAGIKKLRMHDLRHSFASYLASSGESLPLIGALLGHSNPNTTARYAHLLDHPQRVAVEKIGAIVDGASDE